MHLSHMLSVRDWGDPPTSRCDRSILYFDKICTSADCASSLPPENRELLCEAAEHGGAMTGLGHDWFFAFSDEVCRRRSNSSVQLDASQRHDIKS